MLKDEIKQLFSDRNPTEITEGLYQAIEEYTDKLKDNLPMRSMLPWINLRNRLKDVFMLTKLNAEEQSKLHK